MIKIKELEGILKSNCLNDVLTSACDTFASALASNSPVNTYVQDFCSMTLSQPVREAYYNEGLSVLMSVVNSKKKYDISMVSQDYISYTGLLNHEFVIGCDLEKEMYTSIFTKSENLLNQLYRAGAFDDTAKFEKGMKALFGDGKQDFGNKVASCFENNALAMGRIDISGVIGDEVSLDLVIPNKFRIDYGVKFLLYPYSVFPHLGNTLAKYILSRKEGTFTERVVNVSKKIVDIRAITVIQNEIKDDNKTSKTRRITFTSDELVKAYRRGVYRNIEEQEEAQDLLKAQIAKTNIGWDCLKLYYKVYNVEASLFAPIYTGIKLERVTKIVPCSLKEIDTSLYLIDYDSVKTLFRISVNSWNIEQYQKFNSEVDTEQCANKSMRRNAVLSWAEDLDNDVLWKTMQKYNDLFSINDNKTVKTLDDRLSDMYNRRPAASKKTIPVTLSTDLLKRKEEVRDMLNKGVCKIECFSVKNGVSKNYMATNNETILDIAYGREIRLGYESVKNTIEVLKKAVLAQSYKNCDRFLEKIYNSGLDSIVDLQRLQDNENQQEWVDVLDEAYQKLLDKDEEKKAKSSSDDEKISYVIPFRRINADRASNYWGSLDVRNIVAFEFGEQKDKASKKV